MLGLDVRPMAFLYFIAALFGIVLVALVVNRATGTKATYLDAWVPDAGERELWRDAAADLATLPRLGQAAVMSYPRLRRHTVVWTNRRVVVAQQVLLSSKRMLTHQLCFALQASDDAANAAATAFAGGFYGRGFTTIACAAKTFGRVNDKDCVRLQPTADSGATLNLAEVYIFTDQLAALRSALAE
jgi:hypothetical protein